MACLGTTPHLFDNQKLFNHFTGMTTNLAIITSTPELKDRLVRAAQRYVRSFHAVHEAHDLHSAIELLDTHRPTIILLELELGKKTGIDLLNATPAEQRQCVILFTKDLSGAHEVIRFRPIDLLTSHGNDVQLDKALDTALDLVTTVQRSQRSRPSNRQVALRLHNGLAVLHVDDIIHVRSNDDIIEVHLWNRTRITLSRSLKTVEAQLSSEGFIRVHQSFLVNPQHITHYVKKGGEQLLLLSDGRTIPVSKRLKENVLRNWTTI